MKMDVMVTSTCRKTIEKCIPSFLMNMKYSGQFRFLVNIDVKNPKYLPRMQRYLKELSINNVTINMHPKQNLMGLTDTTNSLYKKIKSKFYFNLQDDWIFLEKIDLDSLVTLMDNYPEIDHVRLNKEVVGQNEWLYHLSQDNKQKYNKKTKNMVIDGINLVKIKTWSFNPSICRTETIKNMLPVPNNIRAETYFCHKYDELYCARGAYFYGNIGDCARIKDIGRSICRETLRIYKKRLFKFFI
jgi:hypothetical protein